MVRVHLKMLMQCLRTLPSLRQPTSIHLHGIQASLMQSHLRAFQPSEFQRVWMAYREPRFARSCIVCTNVAESWITIPNVGIVISSGVQRRVSTDVRTGVTVNALQTLSKAQLLQQLGRSGRTDCGIHITMMSLGQYSSQVRSSDLAQLEESDISPMTLRSLVAGRPSPVFRSCVHRIQWCRLMQKTRCSFMEFLIQGE